MDNLKSIKVGQPEFFVLRGQVEFYNSIFDTPEQTLDYLVELGLKRKVAMKVVQKTYPKLSLQRLANASFEDSLKRQVISESFFNKFFQSGIVTDKRRQP